MSSKDGFLVPLVKDFHSKSMIRRQDIEPVYRIFHGEIFKFPSKFNIKFLGDKIRYVIQSKLTSIDIDDLSDLEHAENLISQKIKNMKNLSIQIKSIIDFHLERSKNNIDIECKSDGSLVSSVDLNIQKDLIDFFKSFLKKILSILEKKVLRKNFRASFFKLLYYRSY